MYDTVIFTYYKCKPPNMTGFIHFTLRVKNHTFLLGIINFIKDHSISHMCIYKMKMLARRDAPMVVRPTIKHDESMAVTSQVQL